MPVKHKKSITKNTAESNIKTYISLVLFSFLIYISFWIIACLIGLLADVSKTFDYYVSLASITLASFASGFLSGLKLRKNGLLCGLILSLPANLTICLISLVINGFSADSNIIITLILLIVASACGGILAVNKRHRR